MQINNYIVGILYVTYKNIFVPDEDKGEDEEDNTGTPRNNE